MSGKINAIDQLRLSLNILSHEDVLKIHTATLDVIESIGVRFPSQKALDILEAHGATVDRETMIAKIPGQVVEDALKTAPPIYTLAARDPSQDLPMDGKHVFLGTDGCCIEVIDAFTGERRRTTKKDREDCARVADALEEVGFWWSMVAAQDQPPESRAPARTRSGVAQHHEASANGEHRHRAGDEGRDRDGGGHRRRQRRIAQTAHSLDHAVHDESARS